MAHKKVDLPSKICTICGRPFNWRKKWEKNWGEVKYCSEKCRREKGSKKSTEGLSKNTSANRELE